MTNVERAIRSFGRLLNDVWQGLRAGLNLIRRELWL